MPVDKNKNDLRSTLMEKSVEELEELLALDFTEDENAEVNTDYIAAILEVIEEKEGEQREAETQAAWKEFLDYRQALSEEGLISEAGMSEKPSHDGHHRETESSQKPRKYSRALRYCAIAAVLIVLLCGTAFGWNIFQAIADWTAETFHFLTGQSNAEAPDMDAYEYLRTTVAEKTDVPAIPTWGPEGTAANGELNAAGRKERYVIQMEYTAGEREFLIQTIIHDTIPEDYQITYQKNSTIEEEYKAGGITHYIMGNTETLSAMWTNGCVEGYIQGELTLEEMRQMIDSIYEE